ncbi:hypothetical protein Tco_0883240 [Tanacetum coccineum]
MVERDDEIKVLGEIKLELQSGTHKVIEKLSQEKVSQQEALEKFKWKVVRDHEIKVLGEVNVELESDSKKLREKLARKDTERRGFLKILVDTGYRLREANPENEAQMTFMVYVYTTIDASIEMESHVSVLVRIGIHQVLKLISKMILYMKLKTSLLG